MGIIEADKIFWQIMRIKEQLAYVRDHLRVVGGMWDDLIDLLAEEEKKGNDKTVS